MKQFYRISIETVFSTRGAQLIWKFRSTLAIIDRLNWIGLVIDFNNVVIDFNNVVAQKRHSWCKLILRELQRLKKYVVMRCRNCFFRHGPRLVRWVKSNCLWWLLPTVSIEYVRCQFIKSMDVLLVSQKKSILKLKQSILMHVEHQQIFQKCRIWWDCTKKFKN